MNKIDKYLKMKIHKYIKDEKIDLLHLKNMPNYYLKNIILSIEQNCKLIDIRNNLSSYSTLIMKLFTNIIIRAKEIEQNSEIERRLLELFQDKKNKIVNTAILKKFYITNFKIDYENTKIRFRHYSIISKLRILLNKKEKLEYYLISGAIMKKQLKINDDIDRINGWCYTNNKDWIKEYFNQEMKKHRNLLNHYDNFKKKWKTDSD